MERRRKLLPSNDFEQFYIHNLSLYRTPPQGNISLPDLERATYDRLKVLHMMYQFTRQGLKTNDLKSALYDELLNVNLTDLLELFQSNKVSSLQTRCEDHAAHYALCAAFCDDRQKRAWFIQNEMALFKLRFLEMNSEEEKRFLELNDLVFTPISEEWKNSMREELMDCTADLKLEQFDTMSFYRISFYQVSDLVQNRSVLLVGGFAYVPHYAIVSCIITIYKEELKMRLNIALRQFANMHDLRIHLIMKEVQEIYSGMMSALNFNLETPIELESLKHAVRDNFPLCMQAIYNQLKNDSHLTYFNRRPYILFLKGIGVSVEVCLKHFEDEFTKRINESQFTKKKYPYEIKHAYGLVGSRKEYEPYSCAQIMEGSGHNCYGCPFKELERDELKRTLEDDSISLIGVENILQMHDKRKYEVACKIYFEQTHDAINAEITTHPNQYFANSKKERELDW